MKRTIILLIALCGLQFNHQLNAQQLAPTDEGSSIQFSIRNFGLTTKGSFSGLSGKIFFTNADPLHASFEVHIQANSITTGNNSRDRHLKADDYFDVSQFPMITIKSETITSGGQAGSYILHGILSMKGTSRKIDLPFTVKPIGTSFVFEGSFTINRLDYKIGSSSISLSDNASIYLKVIAKN